MRRKEIAALIERYDIHERYGELTEDDRIVHWLMKKVFEQTKDEKEEPEVEKKSKVKAKEIWDRDMAELREINQNGLVPPAAPAPERDPWWDAVNNVDVAVNLRPGEIRFVDAAAPEVPQVRPANRPWRDAFVQAVAARQGRHAPIMNVAPVVDEQQEAERDDNNF
jgi:hypothetical protein